MCHRFPRLSPSGGRYAAITLGLLGGLILVRAVVAADKEWLSAEPMRRALEQPIGLTWSSQSLREALASLSENQRIAIWLDRRIDPEVEPELSFENTAVQRVLQRVAEGVGGEVGFIGPVVYLGPPQVARKLATVTELRRDESRQYPAASRSKWITPKPVRWPMLATPRELLQAAAVEAECSLAGLETIPHDLWPAADLPPLTLAERLTLILAGFDRTYELAADGRTLRIVPLPDQPQLQRDYPTRGDPQRILADVQKRFPQAVVQRSGSRLVVRGTAEDHEGIVRLLKGEPERRVPAGPPVTQYTMEAVNQPVGVVLKTLAVKAEVQVSVEEGAEEKLRTLVSFQVKEASLEQLLTKAFEGTGLTFQLNGKQLRVSLAQP